MLGLELELDSSFEAVVTRMEEKWMRSAVAVTVGNRYSGWNQVDCHLSAQQLNAALGEHGLRMELWIDQQGGAPMLDRLRRLLASQVRPTDDGFVFCFCGHGGATELSGNDKVPTSYQDIVNAIDAEPRLKRKPKLVVFDCCQGKTAAGLKLPENMIVARSTALGESAWCEAEKAKGAFYSNRLATAIRSYATTNSVEDLLKLTQGEVHELKTPKPQIAHVVSALGAYHLYLGGV